MSRTTEAPATAGVTSRSELGTYVELLVVTLIWGGVSVVLSYVLWNRALLRLGATRTAVFSNPTPLWALVVAHIIESETLAPVHALAALLIIGGVLLALRRGREATTG